MEKSQVRSRTINTSMGKDNYTSRTRITFVRDIVLMVVKSLARKALNKLTNLKKLTII